MGQMSSTSKPSIVSPGPSKGLNSPEKRDVCSYMELLVADTGQS